MKTPAVYLEHTTVSNRKQQTGTVLRNNIATHYVTISYCSTSFSRMQRLICQVGARVFKGHALLLSCLQSARSDVIMRKGVGEYLPDNEKYFMSSRMWLLWFFIVVELFEILAIVLQIVLQMEEMFNNVQVASTVKWKFYLFLVMRKLNIIWIMLVVIC